MICRVITEENDYNEQNIIVCQNIIRRWLVNHRFKKVNNHRKKLYEEYMENAMNKAEEDYLSIIEKNDTKIPCLKGLNKMRKNFQKYKKNSNKDDRITKTLSALFKFLFDVCEHDHQKGIPLRVAKVLFIDGLLLPITDKDIEKLFKKHFGDNEDRYYTADDLFNFYIKCILYFIIQMLHLNQPLHFFYRICVGIEQN